MDPVIHYPTPFCGLAANGISDLTDTVLYATRTISRQVKNIFRRLLDTLHHKLIGRRCPCKMILELILTTAINLNYI